MAVRKRQQDCRCLALIVHEKIQWMLMGLSLMALLGGLSATAQQSDTNTIRIEQTVNPTQIVARGTGSPSTAVVTLKLSGPVASGAPLDLMLILDRSASVELELVKGIARAFVDHLSSDDHVGIVSFSDRAQLDLALTADKTKALQTIDGLTPGIQTALGDGLMLGLDEMLKSGRANAFKLILLPTDGVNNVGQDPMLQTPRATEKQIPIYPIAITPAARRQLLSEIAQRTNGAFFTNFSDDVLESVMRRANRTVAGRFIVITQTLPSYLVYEGAIENPPVVNPGRDVTQLQWQVSLLFQGDVWQSQFSISAEQEGTLVINQEPSQVQYTDAQGLSMIVPLPATTVQVGRGTEQPGGGQQGGGQQPGGGQPGGGQPPTPKVKFTPEAPLAGDAIRFDASESSDPDGQITKYEWDWTNDGTFDESFTEPTALHPFGSAGEFTVKLRVTDNANVTADTTVTIRLAQGLRARAAVSADFKSDPTVPDWMKYYIDDGVVTDEEVRDANARFAADVFIPGTQYRLTSQDVQAVIQVNQLSKLVAKYEDVSLAQTDGYLKVGNFVPEVGQHYVKEAYLSGPVVFDRPPVLLYDIDQAGKLKLAGVRYISTDASMKLFEITTWPNHAASAHFDDGTEQAAATITNAPLKNSQNSPLVYWHPTLYALSVWVSVVNPKGLFASTNPEVKQP